MPTEIQLKRYEPGSSVVVQNARNEGVFYIVKNGTLRVNSQHKFKDKVLSRFEAGDSFGLVSGLTGYHFLVTVVAETPAEVLQIPIAKLGEFLETKKEIAMKMLTLYTRELRAVNRYLHMANAPDQRELHPSRLMIYGDLFAEREQPAAAAFAYNKYLEWATKEAGHEESIQHVKQKLEELGEQPPPREWDSHEAVIPAGEILFLENQLSRYIYLIKSGAVKLFKFVRGKELIIDVLEAGEILGEMSILENTERMASAITTEESHILRFSKETLLDGAGSKIMQSIFISLARRIWFSHQRLLILRIPDPVTRLYAILYNLIRDKDIKNRSIPDHDPEAPYVFHISLETLKSMCGLLKIHNEKIHTFISDTNLEIEDHQITVQNRRKVELQVAYHRSASGEITANLM